jgi:hypothetical protein
MASNATKSDEKLKYLRTLYEPYALGLARNLLITLPPWIPAEKKKDNWQAGPWDRAIQARSLAGLGHVGHKEEVAQKIDDHF